jgi:hypothetical protein
MKNPEKISVSPWSIRAEGDFSTKIVGFFIVAVGVGVVIGQWTAILNACSNFKLF